MNEWMNEWLRTIYICTDFKLLDFLETAYKFFVPSKSQRIKLFISFMVC